MTHHPDQTPFSSEAEEAVIGAVLSNPEAYYVVSEHVTAEDFFLLRHQRIWSAFDALAQQNKDIDYLMTNDVLKERGQLEEIGGPYYLLKLVGSPPNSEHVKGYAGIVWKAAIRRRLLAAGDEIKALALKDDANLTDVTLKAEDAIFSVTQRAVERTESSLHDVMSAQLPDIEARIKGEKVSYLPTGFKSLDTLMGGLERGCLHIVGGRPGMGKSSLCTNMAVNMARLGLRSYYISTEMTVERLGLRIASMETGINLARLKTGQLDAAEWSRYVEAVGRMGEWPLYLDYVPGANPSQIKARVARRRRETGLDVLFIDGLWQMTNPGKYDDNRVLQLGYISRLIVDMAKEYNLPVVLAHQLNRNPEGRQDKRPIMSDLEFSGQLEQNADVILFIYRDEVYNENTEFPNVAEIIAAKNRDNATGMANLYFEKSITRFVDTKATPIDLSGFAPRIVRADEHEFVN